MGAMQRRTFLRLATLPVLVGTPAALAQPALRPSPQDQADIERVEAYLNSIHTLQARFLQVAPDGQLSRGTAWLGRPGRLRFQYDPPNPYLLVTGYGQLIFEEETFFTRILHNETAFMIQRRLQHAGVPMIVLPVRLNLAEGPRISAPSLTEERQP